MLLRKGESPVWGAGWFWPVPDLITAADGRHPATVSQEFKGTTHPGVDIMFRRATPEDDLPQFIPGEVNRTDGAVDATRSGRFIAPRTTPVLAAKSGTVWSVQKTPHGIAVVLDHGKPWATFYQHLATTTLALKAPGVSTVKVTAGQVIGTMGHSPLDGEKLRHLHFEAWYKGGPTAAVDPESDMRTWARSPWQTTL